jgi:hypothetical protein
MTESPIFEPSPAVVWTATAVVVGATVAGAVLVERALSRAWAGMREEIHPFGHAAARLKRARAAYTKRLERASDVGEVIGGIIRLSARSR